MRIAQGGVYVMVQKYGIEGLLAADASSKHLEIQPFPDQEEAIVTN